MRVTQTVDVEEAQARLDELIDMVEGGADIVITRRGAPIARLVRYLSDESIADVHRAVEVLRAR